MTQPKQTKIDIDADAVHAEMEEIQNGSDEAFDDELPEHLSKLRLIKMSEVRAKLVDWLWKPFIAFGTFTLLSGEEGVGKTFMTLGIANAIASGYPLPFCDTRNQPANVLFMSAEDSLAFTLKPRLEAMQANCENIIACKDIFTLDGDGFSLLKLAIAESNAKLVVIDPLFSYVGSKDINRDNEIRIIGNKIIEIAEKYECAILGIRHIGKSKGFGDARNAGLGGIGWRACCRSELLVGANPDDPKDKALVQTKNNLGQMFDKSIGFEIKDGRFVWLKESHLTASQILSSLKNEDEKFGTNDAIEFLKEILKNGAEVESKAIIKDAHSMGITDYSLKQARHNLQVESFKKGFENAVWYMRLPKGVEEVETLEEVEIL
ncbi:MAG: AAA family ATPase [Acidobacteriota bacterium]|nr:AAA family ATPase [Acidobacteriota bacterium]